MTRIVHYKCECGNYGEDEIPWKNAFDGLCSKCKEPLRHYRIKYHKYSPNSTLKNKGGVDALMRDNERWSWSMGINPEDIPKAMKRFPNSEYHPVTGQLKVKNRADKIRQMKERGLVECDGYRNRKGLRRRKQNG